MKKFIAGILILFFIVLMTPQIGAQDDAPKPKYMVWQVKVTPAQLAKTLEAIKFQHTFLKQQNYPYAGFVQYTNDGYLYYSTAFQDYADIDKMNAVDKKLWADNPEKSKEIQKEFEGTYKSVGSIILELQPELSIMAPESDVAPTGRQFRFFQRFYIKQGKGKEFAELTKKYKALRQKHGVTDGFYTFYPSFGPDMSIVYFIDEMGNNAAEHYAQSDKTWEMFGEEGKELWESVLPLLEKTESHIGSADYDFMYIPSN
jgi:hypothetical protein